jgi:hypothetical protein
VAVLLSVPVGLAGCGGGDEWGEGERPGECSNGADDDGDGLTDCGDPGCGWAPICSGADAGDVVDVEADVDPDAGDGGVDEASLPDGEDVPAEVEVPTSCYFGYDEMFRSVDLPVPPSRATPAGLPVPVDGIDRIEHREPLPPWVFTMRRGDAKGPKDDIVMPGYSDTMPRFPRSQAWGGEGEMRCYETPTGVRFLTEPEAYALYKAIAERTTGVAFDETPERRTVVGIRGAYPGTFAWHGNTPDRFNDTLVLLWIGADGRPNVREFPVNTDVGAHDFGDNASSSLRPNRRYAYSHGWHRTYNALHIAIDGYAVRDDTNHNGHWDSDRNGWLPPPGNPDRDRTGGGHNIHMGSVDGPLGSARVGVWSAGCQVIPGMANWTAFITAAWLGEGAAADYFLIDARDVAPEVWRPCTPDGSHACPYRIGAFPFEDARDTSAVAVSDFDRYDCSPADESGPEVVYVFTTDRSGTLSVAVDCAAPVDIDVHLLDGDDADACLARAHVSFEQAVTPGRYFVVADTFVDGEGTALSGRYTLHVDLR